MPEWGDELDREQQRQDRKLKYGLAAELRAENALLLEQDELPLASEPDELPERGLLKRDIRRMALTRMEDAARTPEDFAKVIKEWDRLDLNRERRERYHETLRNGMDFPLEYGATEDGACFPTNMNHVLAKEIRKGDFLDAIFFCPFEIHELVTEEYISEMLSALKGEHKELLFLLAVCGYSTAKAAAIRKQSDRNIRKVRTTVVKKLRAKAIAKIAERMERGLPLTPEEKGFWAKNNRIALDGSMGGQYNCN